MGTESLIRGGEGASGVHGSVRTGIWKAMGYGGGVGACPLHDTMSAYVYVQ